MTPETLRRDWILLRRDWILHRRSLLAGALVFAAFQVYFVMAANHATLWLVFTCIYLSFLAITPLNRDGKFGAEAWSCTLPVTRADLARGRYVTAWALAAGLFLLALALAAFVPGSKLSAAAVLSPSRLLLAAGVTAFIIALLIPFTIRFGLMGILLVGIVLQIGGAVLFVAAQTTGGVHRAEAGIGTAIRALARGVAALPETASVSMVVLVMVSMTWASCKIASALLRRREL